MKKCTTPLPQFESDKELSEYLLRHMGDNLKEAIRATVSVMVKVEMEHMRMRLQQENISLNHDFRFNGAYPKHLVSPFGKVEHVPVPRFRDGLPEGEMLRSLEVFDIEKARVYDLVAQMHLHGVSQRKVDRIARIALGVKVSPKKTKEAFDLLLTTDAFQVNTNPLLDAPCAFLFLDGIWETVGTTIDGKVQTRVTLVALGMNATGSMRKLLGFKTVFVEDEASWIQLLESLEKRGYKLNDIQLVTADGAGGIAAALERKIPQAKFQACLSHTYRNVLKYTPFKLKGEMGKDLRSLTKSQNKEQFVAQVKHIELRWATIAPKAVACLSRNQKHLTTYFDYQPECWSKIRTSNYIERIFKEYRRRTAVQDDHFVNSKSHDRYHAAIMSNLNQTYLHQTQPISTSQTTERIPNSIQSPAIL